MMDPHAHYSDESPLSDESDQHFTTDRELAARQRSQTPSSTSSPNGNSRDGHRRRKQDRHTEVLKMLMNEEQVQSKTTRKFLRTALARLDNETERAQKAEAQALEIAQRFKLVSDAHRQLQAELSRVHEELRLYKVQYDNAQREIHRGQDILKALEEQRDEAEARAAKDRTTARKLKEEQLMLRAREEGRKAGYAEGLKRGLEQARFERLRANPDAEGEPVSAEDEIEAGPDPADLESPADTFDHLAVRNFSSPSGHIESPVPQHIIPPLSAPPPPGEQGSRFREHGIGATPGPRPNSLASGSQSWARPMSVPNAPLSPRHPDMRIPPDGWIPSSGTDGLIRLPPPHELKPPPSPHTPSQPLPIPLRPPSVSSQPPAESSSRDYTYHKRNSQESIPSMTSAAMSFSQFDLLSTPGLTGRKSALSVIQEVSSSMEHSPGQLSRGMPEAVTFPVAPTAAEQAAAADEFPNPRHQQSRQRLADSIRYEDPNEAAEWRRNAELRASSSKQSLPRRVPSNLTAPSPLSPQNQPRDLRPPSAASGASGIHPRRSRSAMSNASDVSGRRPPSSSQEFHIEVVPPSGPPSSTFSPVMTEAAGMLSPNAMAMQLPPVQPVQPPQVPTVPNSPSMGRYPSLGVMPGGMAPGGVQKVSDLPPGFFPSGPVTPVAQSAPLDPPGPSRSTTPSIYGPPPNKVPYVQRSVSSSASSGPGLGPNDYPRVLHSRSRSLGQSYAPAGDELRSKTPGPRPPSAASSSASRPTYAAAPNPAGIQYPAPPGAPGSPRSVASHMSSHTRSLSLNAGNTPAPSTRPLSTAPPPKLRRVPSDASTNSALSAASRSNAYQRYNPDDYVDPAFLASTEDLHAHAFSPNTFANTRANATSNRKSVHVPSRSSPALSYVSLQR